MLIDTVGIDKVIFGTDWPADMAIDWPVSWVLSLQSLTQEEKEAILYKNVEKLLGRLPLVTYTAVCSIKMVRSMRAIDIHAHLTPQCFQQEVLAGRTWHGMTSAEGELFNPMNAWTPEQRLADMQSLGVDVQVVSTNVAFYKYDQDIATTTAIARACNDEVQQMTVDYPRPLRRAGHLADAGHPRGHRRTGALRGATGPQRRHDQ